MMQLIDIPYVPNGDPAQKLDLYLPDQPAEKPQPLVAWIHGGGWRGGSKSGCLSTELLHLGYLGASIEYRFSNVAKFPAQIQDCQAAIRFLRANAKKYNIDPDRIGVWGDSAGGHLCALLGTTGDKKIFPPIGPHLEQSDRVQAVIDFYGPTNFNSVMKQAAEDPTVKNIIPFNTEGDSYSLLLGVKLGENKAKSDAASPVNFVSNDNAPILILHGTADPVVPLAQSVEFFDALQNAGVDAMLQKIPNAVHGGFPFHVPLLRKLTVQFFDKHLKKIDVKIQTVPENLVAVPVTPAV